MSTDKPTTSAVTSTKTSKSFLSPEIIFFPLLLIFITIILVIIFVLFFKEKGPFSPPLSDKVPSNYTNVIDKTKVITDDNKKLVSYNTFFFPTGSSSGVTLQKIQDYLADPNNLKFLTPLQIQCEINPTADGCPPPP